MGEEKIKIYLRVETKCFDNEFSNRFEWEGGSQSDVGSFVKLDGIMVSSVEIRNHIQAPVGG